MRPAKPAKPATRENKVSRLIARDVIRAGEPEPTGPVVDFPPRGQCKWIHGAVPGREWRCCAAPVRAQSDPYCAYHRAASHNSQQATAAAIAHQEKAYVTSHAGKVFH